MMDRKEFDAWVTDNGTGHISRKYINGINYALARFLPMTWRM